MLSSLLRDERPDLVDIDGGGEVAVLSQVEVSHTNLSEISRMVLIHVDSVMVLTTSLTSSTRMLAVLANTAVTHADVSSEASSLLQT